MPPRAHRPFLSVVTVVPPPRSGSSSFTRHAGERGAGRVGDLPLERPRALPVLGERARRREGQRQGSRPERARPRSWMSSPSFQYEQTGAVQNRRRPEDGRGQDRRARSPVAAASIASRPSRSPRSPGARCVRRREARPRPLGAPRLDRHAARRRARLLRPRGRAARRGSTASPRDGVRFETARAHNVVTLPSHANLLSGQLPAAPRRARQQRASASPADRRRSRRSCAAAAGARGPS